MGRLYQTGKMNKEAGVLYDYLMTRDTEDQAARVGAIDVALSENNVRKLLPLPAVCVAAPGYAVAGASGRGKGNHQQAMTYLRSARGKLVGLESSNSAATPTIGGILLADNPFTATQ